MGRRVERIGFEWERGKGNERVTPTINRLWRLTIHVMAGRPQLGCMVLLAAFVVTAEPHGEWQQLKSVLGTEGIVSNQSRPTAVGDQSSRSNGR
jgi:hypothetical protein